MAETARAGSHSIVTLRALAIGFFAVVVALMAHNLTDDLFVHGMDVQFALVVACLLALVPARSGYRRDTP